jgi:hypothetical protein
VKEADVTEVVTDRYGIRRPPTGYAISLYDDLVRDVSSLPAEIDAVRHLIAARSGQLTRLRRAYVEATSTLAWMRQHQADEIAEVAAQREQVRARLREAGWKL